MTSARKRQLVVVALVGAVGVALAVVSFGGIEKNLVYYWSPQDLTVRGDAAKGATIRLGGVVCKRTLEWNSQTVQLRFKVGMDAEGVGPTVNVVSSSAPPQMFREGIGVVVEGRYDGQSFRAERLMVKHSNDYHPPKDGKAPHEMANTLIDESGATSN